MLIYFIRFERPGQPTAWPIQGKQAGNIRTKTQNQPTPWGQQACGMYLVLSPCGPENVLFRRGGGRGVTNPWHLAGSGPPNHAKVYPQKISQSVSQGSQNHSQNSGGDFWLRFYPGMAPKMEPRGSGTKQLKLSWRVGGNPSERVQGGSKIHICPTLTPDLSLEPLFLQIFSD